MKKILLVVLSIMFITTILIYADDEHDDESSDSQLVTTYTDDDDKNDDESTTSQVVTSANEGSIVKLYVATFDRAPDADGLSYWVYQSGLSIEGIAQSFFDQAETKAKYPDGYSTSDFIASVYQNLFKRVADTKGLEYWIAELDNGLIAKSNFILAVMNGALYSDALILANKAQVGLAFAQSGSNDTQSAINIMLNITQDQATVQTALSTLPTSVSNTGSYTLIAWNDLGMHCMDGDDYSVFSILPPYNNLIAQLIQKGSEPKHITSGVVLTYESVVSLDGKWNTTSADKTNFWTHVGDLFGEVPASNVGLTNNPVQSQTPNTLRYDTINKWWSAEGIPTSPRNNDGSYNMYPLVKVVAKSTSGQVLAETTTVLPVSDEMDCKKCHATNSSDSAKPTAGWVNIADAQKDYKLNILRLHDQEHPNAVKENTQALTDKGWSYNQAGLEATVNSGTPILCASCHKSNALPNTGVNNIKALTQALHSKHANVTDPLTNLKLNDAQNRNACYTCHPGATTQCLRGAMGNAKNADGSNKMQCQSCHGTMSAVGSSTRDGWLDEPDCQSCHHDGKRETVAVSNMLTGTLKASLDTRFATNANHPIAGKSLYRYSTGHGDLQCSACHGSTHAIYPSSKAEDNIQSINIQGHAGTIGECTACHTTMPNTSNKGPHGMHSIGQEWVKGHEDVAEDNPTQCTACHGQDYRGSDLSKTMSARIFSIEDGSKSFPAGHKVSCYDCHNGPDGD